MLLAALALTGCEPPTPRWYWQVPPGVSGRQQNIDRMVCRNLSAISEAASAPVADSLAGALFNIADYEAARDNFILCMEHAGYRREWIPRPIVIR